MPSLASTRPATCEGVAEFEAKLAGVPAALDGIEQREANIRSGYVYVTSNIGSFGPGVVKIGVTRRLDSNRWSGCGSSAPRPYRSVSTCTPCCSPPTPSTSSINCTPSPRTAASTGSTGAGSTSVPLRQRSNPLVNLARNLLDYRDGPEAVEYRQSLGQAPLPHVTHTLIPATSESLRTASADRVMNQSRIGIIAGPHRLP